MSLQPEGTEVSSESRGNEPAWQSGSAASAIPFIGKPSAIVQQQIEVWKRLDSIEPHSSALARTVMLCSNVDGILVKFVSAERPKNVDLTKLKAKDIAWTVIDKHSNLMAMQKLYRHDNSKEVNRKRKV